MGGYGFGASVLLILAFMLAIGCAIIPHEMAHAWVAFWSGDPSAKLARRTTPNPARHLDPLGFLCFCFAGIGWAKPVPVNPCNFKNYRRGNFFVSIAGVTVNFAIGLVASLFMYITWKFGYSHNQSLGFLFLYHLFAFCTSINIALMVFNLLPIYPLDGFNVLDSFTKPTNRYMNFMRRNSQWVLLAVLVVLFFTHVFDYVLDGITGGFRRFWGLMF